MSSQRSEMIKRLGIMSESADSAVVPGFDNLPLAIHLRIVLLLPLVERVRSGLVSRRWAALVRDPTVYSELSFDCVRAGAVDSDALLSLCLRAGSKLVALDTSAPGCCNTVKLELQRAGGRHPTPSIGIAPVLDYMKPVPIDTSGLRSLTTWRPGDDCWNPAAAGIIIWDQIDAAALRAACPVLEHATVAVYSSLPGVAAALAALPLSGSKRIVIEGLAADDTDDDDAAAVPLTAASVADRLCGILALGCVRELSLEGSRELDQLLDPSTTADIDLQVQMAAAGERIAAALADSATGVSVLSSASAVLGTLCGALTPQSPLEELDLVEDLSDDEEAYPPPVVQQQRLNALGAALIEGRAPRLQSLSLFHCNGAKIVFDALKSTNTVTELKLFFTESSDGDPAVLAGALRCNKSLKQLTINHRCQDHVFRMPLAPVLGALGGSVDGAGAGSITRLEISGCVLAEDQATAAVSALAALAGSLLRGSPLEEIHAASCGLGSTRAVSLVAALGALAGVGQMKLRVLHLDNNELGDEVALPLARFVLASPSCSLARLNLAGNRIGDRVGVEIARALEGIAAASRVAHLDLSQNELRDAAAEAFGRVLAAQGAAGALRVLNLSNNPIGSKGAGAIAAGLRVGPSPLETLQLSELLKPSQLLMLSDASSLLQEDTAAFGEALRTGAGLKRLELVRNHTAEGISAMAESGLCRSRALESIDVSFSGYDGVSTAASGVLALARAAARDRFGAELGEMGAAAAPARQGTAGRTGPTLRVTALRISFTSDEREELRRIEEAVADAVAARVAARDEAAGLVGTAGLRWRRRPLQFVIDSSPPPPPEQPQ